MPHVNVTVIGKAPTQEQKSALFSKICTLVGTILGPRGMTCWLLSILAVAALLSGPAGAQTVNYVVKGALNQPVGMAFGPTGTLYVTSTYGGNVVPDPFDPSQFVVTGTITAIAPDGSVGLITTAIISPTSIAVDAQGNLYVVSFSSPVVKITPDGAVNPFAPAVQNPCGVALGSDGTLYVSELSASGPSSNGQIVKVAPDGTVSPFIDAGLGPYPCALTFDAVGNLYISTDGSSILKATPAGALSVFATIEDAGAMAFDKNGNMWVTTVFDTGLKSNLDEIAPDGTVTTIEAEIDEDTMNGVVVDGQGDVLYSQLLEGFIQKRTPAGSVGTFYQPPVSTPWGMVSDHAGNLIVSALTYPLGGSQTLQKLAPDGTVSTVATNGISPPFLGILAIDSQDNVYLESVYSEAIEKMGPDGTIAAFGTLPAGAQPAALTVDSQDALYAVTVPAVGTVEIFKFASNGTPSEVATVPGTDGRGIAVDAAGNIYVSIDKLRGASSPPIVIDKITPSGTVSTFAQAGNPGGDQAGPLVFDKSGNLLLSREFGIDSIAPDGTVTTLVANPPFGASEGIALDPAGNLYATDWLGNGIARIAVASSPLAAAVLPGSRSVQLGTPATIFATMINGGSQALAGCAPALSAVPSPSALSLAYQTTSPTTNALTGTPNEPVSLAAGASQSFLLTFDAALPLAAPGQVLNFGCDGVVPAAVVPGVNTVDLSFASEPVPDIVALGATTSGDGILTVPAGGSAAFAVATIDVGSGAPITVSADTGSATLPLAINVCVTNPTTAQCQATPAPSVPITYAAQATPTFSVFVTSVGGTVPFNPAASRIFLRFRGADGALHGSTSVAVKTQ